MWRSIALLAIFAAALTIACGQETVDPTPVLVCPVAAPTVGSPCSAVDASAPITCEYGNDVSLSCNDQFFCSGGLWARVSLSPPSPCPTADPGLGAGCPASMPSGDCTSNGTLCHYKDAPFSPYCVCANRPSGGLKWVCETGSTDCPVARPALGTPCRSVDTRCDYLTCDVPWGASEVCVAAHVWVLALPVCQ